MILNGFFAALGQLGDRRFQRVLLIGVGGAIALLFLATVIFTWLVGWLIGDGITLPWIGTVNWLDNIAEWSTIAAMLVLSVFLMVPVASAVTSLMLDGVAQAVEDHHYAHLPTVPTLPFSDTIRDALGFLGILIVANIVALVIYMIFPVFSPLIFWALNGFLLGREYFTLAAIRRLGRSEAYALRRRHGLTIWVAGTLMAIPLTIPLLNLLVPVIGAATFTHIFHALNRSK